MISIFNLAYEDQPLLTHSDFNVAQSVSAAVVSPIHEKHFRHRFARAQVHSPPRITFPDSVRAGVMVECSVGISVHCPAGSCIAS